jgi:gamma-glutamyl:cysteine ligase YbdK (ATP-grasp superfamily)
MSLAFHPSSQFTVGIEEELLLATPGCLWPSHDAEPVLAALAGEGNQEFVAGEVNDAVVELRTPVCTSIPETVEHLRALRSSARAHSPLLGQASTRSGASATFASATVSATR